jgi:hypothetical protein
MRSSHLPFLTRFKCEICADAVINLDPLDEDESARPKFKDIELCIGWNIVNQSVVAETRPGQKRK